MRVSRMMPPQAEDFPQGRGDGGPHCTQGPRLPTPLYKKNAQQALASRPGSPSFPSPFPFSLRNP